MPQNVKMWSVLIASPGDVQEERKAVKEAIDWWNATHATRHGVMLRAVMWEVDSTPVMGGDPQSLLNEQFVDNSDVVIGIFWSRLGTETPRHESGSVEEIKRLIDDGKPAHIYFSKRDIPQDQLENGSEFARLQEFKKWCRKHGVYGEFDTAQGLSNLVQNHLSRDIDSPGEPNGKGRPSNPTLERIDAEAEALDDTSDVEKDPPDTPIEEMGLLDLHELSQSATEDAIQELSDINDLIASVGSQMRVHTSRIQAAAKDGSATEAVHAKALVNAAASDIDAFGIALLDKSQALGRKYSKFINALRGIIRLTMHTDQTDRVQLVDLQLSATEMMAGMSTAQTSLREFRSVIHALPHLTTDLGRAKRVATGALDHLDKQIDGISRLTDDLVNVITGMEKSAP